MSEPVGDTAPSPDDQRMLEALDKYVEALQQGDESGGSQLLETMPELAEYAECLGLLDSVLASTVPVVDEMPLVDLGSGDGPEQRFGRYELIELIGQGGMGVVYRARQTDLDRIVALKLIRKSQLSEGEEIARFYSEARAAARLRHPNIVGIFEVGDVHGQHYFAMDYVEGTSLARYLQDGEDSESSQPNDSITVLTGPIGRTRPADGGQVDPEKAARWLADIARAVHYLHSHGMIHRDLKPSNILLDEDDNPLVTDFGLARVVGDDATRTSAGVIVGTPGYMAPEQAAGRVEEISPQSDIFSLGVILYEMLTGQAPFDAGNPLDTLVRVIESEPPPPSQLAGWLSPELERICLKCLAKEPKHRYGSASELADDLERYLRRENVLAPPTAFLQRLRRWGRRQPALVARLGALALTAGIVQVSYHSGAILGNPEYVYRITGILAFWAAVSVVFQWLMQRPGTQNLARYCWCGSDAVLLTATLWNVETAPGPLLIGYPLLVAATGLFFRVRLVWFMTLACLLAYAVLVAHWRRWHEVLDRDPWHYPVIFAVVLALIGFVVAYQVYRVRVLSRYYRRGRPE